MATMVYAPEAKIRIYSTKKNKIIDVSEDLVSGSITRTLGPSVSTANWTLLNAGRKYAGLFSPMDRVTIYLRRIRSMLVFSGYLDQVPLWGAMPNSSSFTASCTMKRLQNFYWDPGSPEGSALLRASNGEQNFRLNDGGLAARTITLMDKVVGWNPKQIHIGGIPTDWYKQLDVLATQMETEAELAATSLAVGSDSYLQGESPLAGSFNRIEGIGPGTGVLPAATGRISKFGGPNGGAYGNMALTGESGVKPRDPWYVAMRWPYVGNLSAQDAAAAKNWWKDRRILVVSEKTQKAVVLRAADWGPHVDTGRVIDVSPTALNALGIATDDIVNIAFAEKSGKTAPLGPVDFSRAETGGTTDDYVSTSNSTGMSNGIPTSAWGQHGESHNMVTVSVKGRSFTVHKLAADKFIGFVSDLISTGYQPTSIGGYNDRPIAGTGTWSNHAYGAAIDIDPSRNPQYSSSAGGPYALPKPPQIIQMARKWGLYWGGEYRNSKDYMHFEVIGAPATPKVSGVTNSLQPVETKWVTPIEKPYRVTAKFGDVGSSWAKYHSGTDFANGGEGARIRPVGPGKVHAKTVDSSYGNNITIDHGEKVYTFYAHMQNPSSLAIGAPVDIDSTLGTVGSTGNITGPHVHLELRLDSDTYNAALNSGGIEKYVLGGATPPRGVGGFGVGTGGVTGGDYDTATGGGVDLSNIGGGLLNVYNWVLGSETQEGFLLSGDRALMNDEPVMGTIDTYMRTGFRDFCSAPNGDFIGWFPDYFGFHKQAGKMIINPLEIDIESAPSIKWTDEGLKTHHYAVTATDSITNDSASITQKIQAPYAKIDDPEILRALLNVTADEAEAIASTMLGRYGARPDMQSLPHVSGAKQGFYFACMNFMKNWSAQWRTSIETTFMPEVFPGMLACFPVYGIQGYVQEVSHSFDYSGGGFSTTLRAAPWSTLGESGPGAMVKGAPL